MKDEAAAAIKGPVEFLEAVQRNDIYLQCALPVFRSVLATPAS